MGVTPLPSARAAPIAAQYPEYSHPGPVSMMTGQRGALVMLRKPCFCLAEAHSDSFWFVPNGR